MQITVIKFLAIPLTLALAVWGLYQFNFTKNENREVRMAASTLLRAIDNKDFGPVIENARDSSRVWAIRSEANNKNLGEELVLAAQYINDLPVIISANLAADNPLDKDKLAKVGKIQPLNPFFEAHGAEMSTLMANLPPEFQEPLDYNGHSVRWQTAGNIIAGYTRLKPNRYVRESSKPAPLVSLPAIPRTNRMNYYRGLVENFARRFNLNTSLVMAIIHSESDFSPSIISNKSAMGLMQLLPSTASDEVHRFLYGRRGQIGFEDLRNPEINIRYGTAYLHILLNRYFANVRNRDVQEVCAIASYNLGPNRFLRLYGTTNEKAVEKINSMSEDDFYEDLIRRLPARETRFFVQKVRKMKKHYSSLPPTSNSESDDD